MFKLRAAKCFYRIGIFMKKVFFVVIFLASSLISRAQFIKLTDSTAVLGQRIMALLAQTKNPNADTIGQEFNAIWESGFSPAQQKKIVRTTLAMRSREMPTIPFFRDYFGTLTDAVNIGNLSGEKADNLIDMLSKALEASEKPAICQDTYRSQNFL